MQATKNVEFIACAGPDELARKAAASWLSLTARPTGPRLVAFSGGRIARNFFRETAAAAAKKPGVLDAVDFFWADERCVPPDDPDSNYLPARENLFDLIHVAPGRIHRLKGELPPAAAVAEANAEINRLAPKNSAGIPVLDLVFLGLGEDGHVASLMPNVPDSVGQSTSPFVHVANSPKPPPNRLTLTYPVLAAAKEVWVLVSGDAKRDALLLSLRGSGATPLGRVIESRARTVVYRDFPLPGV